MTGYIIAIVTLLITLIVGSILIITNKLHLNRKLEIVLGIFTISCYLLVFSETITNSSFENQHTQLIWITNSITPLFYFLGTLSFLLPKSKVKDYLLMIIILASPFIIYSMIEYLSFYMNGNKYFYERVFWYTFGQTIYLLYPIYYFKNNSKITSKIIVISLIILGVLYLSIMIYNSLTNGLLFNKKF